MSTPHSAPGDWILTFEDDFDGSTLDLSKWNPRYIGSVELADPDQCLANYVLKDSILYLRLDAGNPPANNPPESRNGSRVSGINTAEWLEPDGRRLRVFFAQKYGWFEVRSRMPEGKTLHSAFWLLLANHIDNVKAKAEGEVVEIDIFEQPGGTTGKHENYFNIHYTETGHLVYDMGFDPSLHFHTYALEWYEGKMIWHIDGKPVWTYTGSTPQSEMYVLLGLYEGSDTLTPVDPNMKYPRDFEIDHVRVYRRKDYPSGLPAPAGPRHVAMACCLGHDL